ncbi:hypothetical protein AQJ54_40220 [Streptomyces griseorubiginosus]|uniref:Uncharacterized protein n=1 Tax=Streptomyces griseorubiginosus TaxID=67304 RepID=A0A117QX86_9ACTN|nr:hypothetical protein AQJ54_40220 [Streptomyces griseorubiginosus]
MAMRLLEHRDGLDDGDEVTYWLDEIAEVLPNCRTPIQFVSLETYVKAAIRELEKAARRNAGSAGATMEANQAYAAAAELIAGS